jgi:hypothetical protein
MEISVILWELGGNPYFTHYHGHVEHFQGYLQCLLMWDIEWANNIFGELRTHHVVARTVSDYIIKLKNWAPIILVSDLKALFSSQIKKKDIRAQYKIPYGLYSCSSWIIALWWDPNETSPGQTQFSFLLDILAREKINLINT